MMKHLIAAMLAVGVCAPQAAAQSLLQRSDWHQRQFETYLPQVNTTVPWLEIDTKTKLPKGDIPLGRDVAVQFVFPSGPDIQVSTNADSPLRRM